MPLRWIAIAGLIVLTGFLGFALGTESAFAADLAVIPRHPHHGADISKPDAEKRLQEFATRANLTGKEGIDKKKLVLLAGGLVIAVAFFVFSQFQSKPVKKHPVPDGNNSKTRRRRVSRAVQLP